MILFEGWYSVDTVLPMQDLPVLTWNAMRAFNYGAKYAMGIHILRAEPWGPWWLGGDNHHLDDKHITHWGWPPLPPTLVGDQSPD